MPFIQRVVYNNRRTPTHISQKDGNECNNTQDFAATKIQRAFRASHQPKIPLFGTSELVDGISITTRRRLISHMELLTDYIEHSPSATHLNRTLITERIPLTQEEIKAKEALDAIRSQNNKRIDSSRGNLLYQAINVANKVSSELKFSIDKKIANCSDFAYILFIMLINDPHLPPSFKKDLNIATLAAPEDHAFLMYQDLIIDPWFGHLDLRKNTGFRKYNISAKGATPTTQSCKHVVHRNRGFIGSKGDFLTMLTKEGEDGVFVMVNHPHEICLRHDQTTFLRHRLSVFSQIIAPITNKLIVSKNEKVKPVVCCIVC